MSTAGIAPSQIAEALRPTIRQGYESLLFACQQTIARVSGVMTFDLYPLFLFSGFLAFHPDIDKDELAVGVVLIRDGLIVNISSDLCLETGHIVLGGPSSSMGYEKLLRNPDAALKDWNDEFQQFLPRCKSPILHYWESHDASERGGASL